MLVMIMMEIYGDDGVDDDDLKNLHTQNLSTQWPVHLHTHVFTRTCIYAKKLLHGDVFTQREIKHRNFLETSPQETAWHFAWTTLRLLLSKPSWVSSSSPTFFNKWPQNEYCTSNTFYHNFAWVQAILKNKGILRPYNSQVSFLSNSIHAQDPRAPKLTVADFQGVEGEGTASFPPGRADLQGLDEVSLNMGYIMVHPSWTGTNVFFCFLLQAATSWSSIKPCTYNLAINKWVHHAIRLVDRLSKVVWCLYQSHGGYESKSSTCKTVV